jgi:hypothetical protein
MELSVLDRLMLLNILPKNGDVTTLRIVRQLNEDLSFSEEEHAALGFEVLEGQVKWKTEGDPHKDIEIGPRAWTLICDTLERLSKEKDLTLDQLVLYDKFIPE